MQSGKDTSVLMCLFIIPNSSSYEPGTLRMKNNLIKRAAIARMMFISASFLLWLFCYKYATTISSGKRETVRNNIPPIGPGQWCCMRVLLSFSFFIFFLRPFRLEGPAAMLLGVYGWDILKPH